MYFAIRMAAIATGLLLSTGLYAIPPAYTLQGGFAQVEIGSDSDDYYYLTGGALFSKSLSNKSIVDLTAELSTYEYSDSDDLSSEEIFLEGSYRYTPRAGYSVPTYSLGLRLREESVDDDDLDATNILLLADIFYRIDDRTSIRGGVKLGERDAQDTTDITGIYANLDLNVSPGWIVYTTLGFDEGADSVRSYCSGSYTRRGSRYGRRTRFAADDCEDLYLTIGANWAIASAHTLDFAASFHDYDIPNDSETGEYYTVDYFFRF